MKRLAIFASGSGSNAENIALHFQNSLIASVSLIITNNPGAGVIRRAEKFGIPVLVFSKNDFLEADKILKTLDEQNIDFLVLAGFLLLIPIEIIQAFKNKIINIHPALLPQFGGKGFFGANVHQKVIETKTIISGITVHHVNEFFDDGEIIFQAACHVDKTDSANSLAEKIHHLEKRYFPIVIEKILLQLP